ncbi:unnamed protein product [Macrosiphum euphorbiae]|uniref:Uncharacterized protein n=1 Tax=Macrosiphum euphorbiae TaxID=13131 RepID=A0AAV0W2T4_9HEMI|nr:unnamed protein product [Macrosiphum euphorbiae]
MFFRLSNTEGRKELKVVFKGAQMKHNFTPKYLGITMVCTLTFNEHLDRTGKKIRSRVNLIEQLAKTGLGADAKTLLALVLTYSAAAYGAKLWLNSA